MEKLNYRVIENGLIPVMENKEGENLVSARKLHEFLEVKTKFIDWIKDRIEKYGFIENTDFTLVSEKKETNNPRNPYTFVTEYILTLDTAKEIAMVQNNKKGKQARRYFIEVEKKHKKLVRSLSNGNSKAGGLNGLLKTLNGVMKDEKMVPWRRAEVIKDVAENYWLVLPEEFINKPAFIQITLNVPIER